MPRTPDVQGMCGPVVGLLASGCDYRHHQSAGGVAELSLAWQLPRPSLVLLLHASVYLPWPALCKYKEAQHNQNGGKLSSC